MNSNNSYYSNLWTGPRSSGSLFWENVDHTIEPYQYQEEVFRNHISYLVSHNIRSVLELGAGYGRMTKIVLEELGSSIVKYDCVELDWDNQHLLTRMRDYLGSTLFGRLSGLNLDVTSKEFDLVFNVDDYTRKYDLILCSEILMHILPSDIENVISKVSKLLSAGGAIINIDWAYSTPSLDNCGWCFIHDYSTMYEKYGLTPISYTSMRQIKQGMYHYVNK